MRYGLEPAKKVINRDICPACVESLVLFFEPRTLDSLVNEIVAEVERQYKSEPESEAPAAIEGFIKSETLTEAEQATTFEVEIPKPAESLKSVEHITTSAHVSYKPAEEIREVKTSASKGETEKPTVICEYCKKEFTAKSKRSRFCSHKCENHDWMDRNKKKKQDELLVKLKKENPIKRETERPNIYREM